MSPLATPTAAPTDICWTPWPGTGPGTELLGDLTNKTVIELGCGSGNNAAALAAAGAHVTAIDRSQAAITKARGRWGHLPRLRFLHTDAATYLTHRREPADIVLSIFGALTFTPSHQLLSLITHRLTPNGRLATALRTLTTGATAALAPAWPRHVHTEEQWTTILAAHGLHPHVSTHVPSPHVGDADCIVSLAVSRGCSPRHARSSLRTRREAFGPSLLAADLDGEVVELAGLDACNECVHF